jgi:hypothetical protein
MVEQASHYRSYDPDIDTYDDNVTDHRVAPYRFGQAGRTGSDPDTSVPLFLSDSDGEPDPSEYITPLRKNPRALISSRILAGVLAIAAMAILLALISSDATRDVIISAKASIAAVLPASSAAAQPDPVRLTAADLQLKDPARLSAPANQTSGVQNVTTVAVAVAPTRAEINSAYQNALQGRAPAAAITPTVTQPAARKLDAGELAALLKRAKSLIAIGDIASARLLLERAADAQEAGAALLLAQTYDPAVLGTPDMRSITPDPTTARGWYQKAARFGSQEAQQRLAQMQN